jgi:hypothetical protein
VRVHILLFFERPRQQTDLRNRKRFRFESNGRCQGMPSMCDVPAASGNTKMPGRILPDEIGLPATINSSHVHARRQPAETADYGVGTEDHTSQYEARHR